jgi:hypothetical protein
MPTNPACKMWSSTNATRTASQMDRPVGGCTALRIASVVSRPARTRLTKQFSPQLDSYPMKATTSIG